MAKLAEYRRKRDFKVTSEPAGGKTRAGSRVFVIQKHSATRLHYDLRLEMDGVLKSWAVPKGPSLDPSVKRLAIHVEDHPFEYRKFEGQIPAGQYGAGDVIIWDRGTYEIEGALSGEQQLEKGDLKFTLHGEKLRGSFALVKLRRSERQNEWLLIKHRDEFADAVWNIDEHGESVVSGRAVQSAQAAKSAARARLAGNERGLKGGKGAAPPALRAADTPGAVRAPMPTRVDVTLAKLGERIFSNAAWLFEIKWDGVRTVARITGESVELQARSGRDVTREYPEFQDLAKHVRASNAVLDGEIVALDADGRSNFQKLQDRIGVVNPSTKLQEVIPLTYYCFDLLYCDGFDLRRSPLLARKKLLGSILPGSERVRYSEHVLEKGGELLAAARQKHLEGIIGKEITSAYSGSRTSQWLKFKIVNELDAVVAGWTAPRRSRKYFGALVLGLYRDGKLQFIGSVGTGFDEVKQKQILDTLQEMRAAKSAFEMAPRLAEEVEWVRPEMVARVKFANWTDGDNLRAPVFLSLRNDKLAKSCTFAAERVEAVKVSDSEETSIATAAMESAPVSASPRDRTSAGVAAKQPKTSRGAQSASGGEIAKEIRNAGKPDLTLEVDGKNVHMTHLDKVYFPESGITKRDLLVYYSEMADYILPFIADRPLVLRRYPNGITGTTFFQKEAPTGIPEWLKTATVYSDERGGEMRYVMADDRAALLYLTNLGCIDHNPWSSRAVSQDMPDWVFFDLDPTPDTAFGIVLQVAAEIYEVLKTIKIKCYLKTSGASGFHIFVPLREGYTYEQTRTFAEVVGRVAAGRLPKITTFERAVRRRPAGTVLIDALQNARGKPLAAAYCVRAFAKAPVSTPLDPAELKSLSGPGVWNIRTIPGRMKTRGDLWGDFWKSRQDLEPALGRLEKMVKAEE
ncbi:MAG: DNA ligase D [Candidatus Acidiferrum sp.]|jgi:bifunctional non-homologous end joining protein LigD